MTIIKNKENRGNYDLKKQIIQSIINAPLTKAEIAENLNASTDEINNTVLDLMAADNIYVDGGKYYPILKSFYDEVLESNLSEQDKDLIIKRIYGATLEEIAKKRGKSKEAIRLLEKNILLQIQEKYQSHIHLYIDNFYDNVFPAMRLDPGFFNYLVSNHNTEILSAKYYLDRFKNSYQIKKSIFDMNFFLLPELMQESVLEYYKPTIVDTGIMSNKYDIKIATEILKVYGPMTTNDLYDMYINKIHLYSTNDKTKKLKYFQCTILESNNVIRSNNKGLIRYYNFSKYMNEVDALIPEIIKISKQYIGRTNIYYIYKPVAIQLKKIEINNKYELHSILRKVNPPNISVTRIPYVNIN